MILGDNLALLDIESLSNLRRINGILHLYGLASLESLQGLDSLDYRTIKYLYLQYSPRLKFCSVKSICDYFGSGGLAIVEGNAGGCSSKDQIVEQCDLLSVESAAKNTIRIYPNPASDKVRIIAVGIHKLQIHDLNGYLLYETDFHGDTEIDISTFSNGYYVVTLQSGTNIISTKIIKI